MAAAVLIALALVIAGVGLFFIFEAALDRRTADELNHTAKLLAGGLGFGAGGELVVDQAPADPRYATPYGGAYWQIDSVGRKSLRSRSLWDKMLTLPNAPAEDMAHHATTDIRGWDGSALIAVFRTVRIKPASGSPLVVITVAMDRAQLAPSREMVLRLLPVSIAALAVILGLAMVAFVHRALSPFRTLRADLRRLHEGADRRLVGDYPSEVRALVDDLNRLVEQQEGALARAQTQAADMAHGLKTPLAVLDALARRIEDGHPALAAEVDEQSLAMHGQVARALARSRAVPSPGLRQVRTPVAPVAGQLVSAMKRLPGSERIEWRVAISPEAVYPASEGELLEALGNIVDNARKWARSVVAVTTEVSGASWAIAVEDDGPGMDPDEIAAIGRGRRWDEAVAGTGFGLAITRDVVEAAGARLTLSAGTTGGLKAQIEWDSKS